MGTLSTEYTVQRSFQLKVPTCLQTYHITHLLSSYVSLKAAQTCSHSTIGIFISIHLHRFLHPDFHFPGILRFLPDPSNSLKSPKILLFTNSLSRIAINFPRTTASELHPITPVPYGFFQYSIHPPFCHPSTEVSVLLQRLFHGFSGQQFSLEGRKL